MKDVTAFPSKTGISLLAQSTLPSEPDMITENDRIEDGGII